MAIASPKKKAEQTNQFKINPEINARLEAFMKDQPGLVEFVKNLSREQLERKFILRHMMDHEQRQVYDAKVKVWLEKPEQAEVLRFVRATVSPNLKPDAQEREMLTQAKKYIHNNKIKIG